LQQGDALGALAMLRRIAQNPDSIHDDATDTEIASASLLRRLDQACAACPPDDAAAKIQVLGSFEREFPQWDEPSFRLAEMAAAAGDVAAAEQAYGRCVEKNPARPDVLFALGQLLLRRMAVEPACKLLKICCALSPQRHEAWNALGCGLLLQGNAVFAIGAFAKAQRLVPTNIEYALNRAEAAVASGRAEEELARLEGESENDPCNAAYLTARGELLARLGQNTAAIDLFEAAATLAPEEKLPLAKLGTRLTHAMRPKEAERVLERALALDPGNAKLGIIRSVALLRLGRYRESCALLEGMIAQFGEDGALLGNLSAATLALGHQEDSVEQARRAIAHTPDNPAVRRTLCNNLPYRDGITASELSEELRETGRRWPRDVVPPFSNWRNPDRKLRIGLLSGTLKMHPVGWLTIGAFEALDPAEFELVRLSAFEQADYISQRFVKVAPERHDTAMYDDGGAARHIRAIGIDILIDLGGYGDHGRMPICAYRAAPVQIKWVGMQYHTSGLAEMDWIVSDRWEIPPELAHHYTEQPLYLPDGYVCYSPPPDAPDVVALPALHNGYVTFGCFNNLSKLTPRTVAAWAKLLHRLPTARLIVKAPQLSEAENQQDVRERFAACDISGERLTLRGASPHRTLLGEYGDIDIVLDPFPYNGGLTTCEALWMGVPTVTLPGEIFASRHSLSHLSNVGLGDWVARDEDDYLALAMHKAADLENLATLRAGLREQVRRSPLCDATRFGKNFSLALRAAWRAWCEKT
jgi:predicted O-linked N-acetylglucosamine transferase (SPINDLY family)